MAKREQSSIFHFYAILEKRAPTASLAKRDTIKALEGERDEQPNYEGQGYFQTRTTPMTSRTSSSQQLWTWKPSPSKKPTQTR